MRTTNPFADDAPMDLEDRTLVERARAGDRDALEGLVQRHQGWIYNIAFRMLYHPQDAEDATQEILLKALTRLSSFEGRSSFRTWLYRIVVNHVLNMKRGRAEQGVTGFRAYGDTLDRTPDSEPPDLSSVSPDVKVLVAEAMISCTSGMLLCLDREQRLAYILGEILGATDAVAADVLDISCENFSSTTGPRTPRTAQLHERQVRTRKPREPMPMCQEDARLHSGRPRRSGEPPVRSRADLRGAGSRTESLRGYQDPRRQMCGHLPPPSVLQAAGPAAYATADAQKPRSSARRLNF